VLAPIGIFLTALDVVVVSTALPVMQRELDASLADLEWTINAYNLAFACLLLTGAALGDRFGRRRMFVTGLLIFTLASAAAALSDSAAQLVAARVVQGAGAAVVMPLTLTLIIEAFPAGKRGTALGIWGGVAGLGVAAGPVVGGAITEGLAWQWIFWVNVPIGLAVAALSALRLRESHGPRARARLDIPGLALAAAGLFPLTWGAVRAPAVGWSSAEVVGSLAAGAVCLAAFVAWERRAPQPMLPLAHFRRRGFATANAVAFLQSFSLIGALFLIAQMFQTGLGHSPLGAGVRMLIWNGTLMIVAPVAGALADRFGNRPLMLLGMTLQGVGLGWLAAVTSPGVAYTSLVLPLLLSGIGISMVFPPVANLVTSAVPIDDVGVASGVNSAMRETGAVFGVAIVSVVFAGHGGYASPAAFIDGFGPAMWVAAGVALAAVIPAALAPRGTSSAAAVTPAEAQTQTESTMAAAR
jgi:EmrB/QacA subfamily drug resistance transporter